MAYKIVSLLQEMEALRDSGEDSILIDDLIQYIKKKQTEGFLKEEEHNHQEDLQHASNLEALRHLVTLNLEMFRSVLTLGHNSLKATFFLNGSASIALLAFLGNVWSKNPGSSSSQALALPLFLFCLGVFFSAISTCLAWCSQNAYANISFKYNPFTEKEPPKCPWGDRFKVASISTVILSLLLFLSGIYRAKQVFITVF